ncbi:hypothetical protein ACQPZG_21400 [Streptomyces sp. CA-294286]|uniref:hypothetical protein n=1 Tax=Streptomyces sp. CA-294286 TaxID=3240070 RepID=UPI003D8B03D6
MRDSRVRRSAAALSAVLLLLPAGTPAAADGTKPAITLSRAEAGQGGEITVRGSGWRPGALLTLLICGAPAPAAPAPGGADSCANGAGRTVTTDARGAFHRRLPVTEPPKPCPCVVHVAAVTGRPVSAAAAFTVAGHPAPPLPGSAPSAARLAATGRTVRLDGSSTLLTWFGAPQTRTVVLRVGNAGTDPVTDPVFRVGTSHGILAPQWEERPWRGTLAPGEQTEVALDVALAEGAHGDYLVSVKHGEKLLAAQEWDVGRPWGVVLFWLLTALVVPAGLFRAGMALVDRARPGTAGPLPVRRGGEAAGERPGAAGEENGAAEVPVTAAEEGSGGAGVPVRTAEEGPGAARAPTRGVGEA